MTIAIEEISTQDRIFWGWSRTAAYFGVRLWNGKYLYIGLGDAS